MGRKAAPGITFYRTNCDHVRNKKIKLLFNEFGADGYWIWQCIVSAAYEHKGYYFDCNDPEELELFASDVCKKRVALVKEVIAGCVRRGLFDQSVYDEFGVLTSEMMQDVYLEATKERRKKGTVIELVGEFILTEFSNENGKIAIIPWKKGILPGNNSINPGKILQSRVDKSKVEKYPPIIPPGGDDVEGKKSQAKKPEKKSSKKIELDLSFIPENYRPVYTRWLEYRRSIRKNFRNQKTLEANFRYLVSLSNKDPALAEKIIDQSINNEYQGLFPLKNFNKNGKTNKTSTHLRPTGGGVPSGAQDYGNP